MTLERYNPADIEDKWYQTWIDKNLFAPSMKAGTESFCIVIPPPNVTGSLHMGHAWDNTLQDILIRWKRMAGFNTLWIPGTDHAGIATQWMVEKALKEKKQTKEELGREAFLKEAWQFKEKSHGTITGQLKKIGVSCDWTRERFTLDEGLSRAVRKVFVELYNQDLIYRANRMVSWCPRCLTALSDLEVNHKDANGSLWHFRYPLADGSGAVVVATTRPETMLGDTAVAVHPEDERYQSLIGKEILLPLAGRPIPVIADDYVDKDFGSGAVKITPAHDPNDFDMAKRHNLALLNVMNEDGTMGGEIPEAYRGLDRFAARKKVLADLDALGLLDKEQKHAHAVGTCSRCATVVEPRVSEQWFVKMKDMASAAIDAVSSKSIELQPEYQEKIFYEWMNNIQDWCISRQLWWGHRIPVWYCEDCGKVSVSEEETLQACSHCASNNLRQETDVLDTWFSSGLWPFSTMGWPENTTDLKTFYPTSVLITGYDILFFWVARMAMLGIKFMDQIPFSQVLLHGLLRDKNGDKMSKTKGNGIDPLEMVEKYGADALRFTLATGTVLGRDMVLNESNIEGYRNFINKIWNATRFALGHAENLGTPKPLEQTTPGRFDQWILARTAEVAEEVNTHLEEPRFNEAAKTLYAFVWHEVCDWYLEIIKPVLMEPQSTPAQEAAMATIWHVLGESLKMLHPFMPFATEELWEKLNAQAGPLIVEKYPVPGGEEKKGEKEAEKEAEMGETARVSRFIQVVQTLRTIRGENRISPKLKVDVIVVSVDETLKQILTEEEEVFKTLGGVQSIQLVDSLEKPEGHAHGVGTGFEVFVSLEGLIDVAAERTRLTRETEKNREKIQKLTKKLENPAFTDKAPTEVVEKNRLELSDLQTRQTQLEQSLTQLPG